MDPRDILKEMHKGTDVSWSGTLPTFSGRIIDLFNLTESDISLTDIFWGMAHKFRFAGQANPPITVAEHSVLVSRIIEILWPNDVGIQLAGLLHDACEGYSQDITARIRTHVKICPPGKEDMLWEDFDHHINTIIFKSLNLNPALLEDLRVIAADKLGASFERRDAYNLSHIVAPPIPDKLGHLFLNFLDPPQAFLALKDRAKYLGIYSDE